MFRCDERGLKERADGRVERDPLGCPLNDSYLHCALWRKRHEKRAKQ